MALKKPTIVAQINALISDTEGEPLEKARAKFCDKLADVIIEAIKSATVTLPAGSITTTGSATTQTNLGPAQGTLH